MYYVINDRTRDCIKSLSCLPMLDVSCDDGRCKWECVRTSTAEHVRTCCVRRAHIDSRTCAHIYCVRCAHIRYRMCWMCEGRQWNMCAYMLCWMGAGSV